MMRRCGRCFFVVYLSSWPVPLTSFSSTSRLSPKASASSVVGDILSAIDLRARGITAHRGVVGDPQRVTALRLPVVLRTADGVRISEPRALDDLATLATEPGIRAAIPLLM